jgi:hypothetical protein
MMVALQIPGSPPISTMKPGAMPPPGVRFSSQISVIKRAELLSGCSAPRKKKCAYVSRIQAASIPDLIKAH